MKERSESQCGRDCKESGCGRSMDAGVAGVLVIELILGNAKNL